MTPESQHQIIAQMALDLKSVQSKLDRLESLVSGSANFAEGWATSKDAAVALRNEGVKSARHLGKLRVAGAFDGSKAVRNVSKGNSLARWEYNISASRKALQRYFQKLNQAS
jgi:hypothetical protein